jgi:hypothetical protein
MACLAVLVDQNWVAVGVLDDDAGGPFGAVIDTVHDRDALSFELLLKLSYVGELSNILGVLVPTRMKVSMFLSNIP